MSLLDYKNEYQFLKLYQLFGIPQIIPFKHQQFLKFLEVTLIWKALFGLKMFFRTVNQCSYDSGLILKFFKLFQANYGEKKTWRTNGFKLSDRHLSSTTGKSDFLSTLHCKYLLCLEVLRFQANYF